MVLQFYVSHVEFGWVEFEWDEQKSQRNAERRELPFAFAARIFDGDVLEQEDVRRDYRESRLVAIGIVRDMVLVVIYTWRGERRRIISARPANRREQRAYREVFTG